MYNLTLEGSHPSTICVEISKLRPSLESLYEMLDSEYVDEYLSDFISEYARTDEIMPEDHTLGFVVINAPKKHVSFAFNGLKENYLEELREMGEKIRSKGYTVDYDI
ncbi:MAG: TA0956 family protein [Cuniculiplasma sp.]